VAVRIRMKRMGRKHRSFFRICATDSRSPRDGRVIEELGTYDPHVVDTDARTTIDGERLKYWLSVGAKPSEKVAILIKKYGPEGIRAAEQQAARERMTVPKAVPDPGPPTFVLQPKKEKTAEAPAPAAETPAAETPAAETTAAETPAAAATATEPTPAEQPAEAAP
jgi:small subunit ribosomal protein S16